MSTLPASSQAHRLQGQVLIRTAGFGKGGQPEGSFQAKSTTTEIWKGKFSLDEFTHVVIVYVELTMFTFFLKIGTLNIFK